MIRVNHGADEEGASSLNEAVEYRGLQDRKTVHGGSPRVRIMGKAAGQRQRMLIRPPPARLPEPVFPAELVARLPELGGPDHRRRRLSGPGAWCGTARGSRTHSHEGARGERTIPSGATIPVSTRSGSEGSPGWSSIAARWPSME